MYTVMLVDDETWVIKNLKNLINWKEHNMEIISEASDGLVALSLVQKLKPDILITDVRMPGLDGLELIRKYAQINPNAISVIVSGYNEFPYVQKALRIEAFDYILKPIDQEAIENLLLRISIKLNNKLYETNYSSKENSAAKNSPELMEIKTCATINKVKSYIEDYYQNDLSLATVAQHFYLSPSYLSDFFRRTTGVTYSSYVTKVRIEKAKQLLQYTDYPVETVGLRVGYKDYRQFVRAFKRICNETPTQFRDVRGLDKIHV